MSAVLQLGVWIVFFREVSDLIGVARAVDPGADIGVQG